MKIIRGSMLTFTADPFLNSEEECLRHEQDAAIVVENGKITMAGNADKVLAELPPQSVDQAETTRYTDSLILPGFIDAHVHYAQTQIIGAYGLQLLDWLNKYTFVAEQQFADSPHAEKIASFFIDEMLKNGTTSCCAFCTVFPQSVDAFFNEACKRGLRMAAGKVCMDRNAPHALLDTPQKAYDDSKRLIEKWHGKDRLEFVLTPRFAPTSSPEQLAVLGALAGEFPDMAIQSHISENINEVAWVKELFPTHNGYADVYDKFGLLRKRAAYGHGVHLTEDELAVFSERGASVVHCPTSNMFIGSGCFDVLRAKKPARPVQVGLGTDIGAGTGFSMLQTLNEAYKTAQLNGVSLSPWQAFYLATRGSAECLGLENSIGSLEQGMEADMVVLDLKSTPLLALRMQYADSLQEALFLQMILGDDRAVRATWSGGELVYSKE